MSAFRTPQSLFLLAACLLSGSSQAASGDGCHAPDPAVLGETPQMSALIASLQQSPLSPKVRCQSLEVGQARTLDYPPGDSPSGVEGRYRLRRIGKKEYEVVLNPVFYARRSEAGTDDSLNERLRKGMQSCFNAVNRALLGPDGQRLRLSIAALDDRETPPVRIGVEPGSDGGYRSSSGVFAEGIECPTLVHETMHLLGLVDEYRETGLFFPGGKGRTFNCRRLGPENSLMSDHSRAFDSSFAGWRGRPYIYSCACQTQKCRVRMASWSNDHGTCPPGAQLTESRFGRLEETDLPTGTTLTSDSSIRRVAGIRENQVRRSLLTTAHFNVIVHPGCSVNDDYYACSDYSTRDASQPNGCGSPPPHSCRDGSTEWLGTFPKPARP